jgi:DNA-directed RNA polymerase specialized sigma24 family protein
MDRGARRSRGVSQTAVAEARDAPAEADLAFDRLYRSSRDDVYAYVAGLLHDGPAAEEVTATAFERAYRKRRRFDPRRGEPRAWLFGIARNAALDELRRRGRQAELAADLDGAAVETGAERSEQRLALCASVVLIALAVLAPIGLIVLWLVNGFRVRRLRERTLS